MTVANNSRYLLTDIVQIVDPVTGALSQPEYVDLRQRVATFAADDKFLRPTDATDWSHLAFANLGDARHWWVIADMSNVIDPFTELDAAVAVGGTLRCPSQQRFFFQILAPEQSTT